MPALIPLNKELKVKKTRLLLPICTIFLLSSCLLEEITNIDNNQSELTSEEVISGLKTALSVGVDTAASRLGRTDGYLMNKAVEIVLPPDVSQALSFVEGIRSNISWISAVDSFLNLGDKLHLTMNRAAEEAASLSAPIFKDAITSMTIADGFGILNGPDTAATTYLREKTYTPLSDAYTPLIDDKLSSVGATRVWNQTAQIYNQLASAYNSARALNSGLADLPVSSLNTDLAQYTTEHALDGLFYMVGEEEQRIREDPVARVTDILKKVFGSLD